MNITITKTIVQPEAVINDFADSLGYQTVVTNPDYVAAVGSETIQDPDWVKPEDFDEMTDTIPQVPNPDYVLAVGEPTMANPQSRKDFVSEKFDEFVAEQFFGQFAKRNAERLKAEEAKELTRQTVAAIKATIVTK